MNIEEMRNNVGNLSQITANLGAGVTELEVIGYVLMQYKNDILDTTNMLVCIL